MIRFFRNHAGATAIEYAVIASLIAVAVVAAMTLLGTSSANHLNTVSNQVENAMQ